MWRTLLIGTFCLALSSPSWAQTSASVEVSSASAPKLNPGDEFLTFTVSKTIRGDILQLDSGKNLKLIGVKSPDLATPNSQAEYFSREAVRYTSQLVQGKEVKVTFDRRKTDSFGQWLGYVWLKDDELLNAKIIRDGYGLPEDPSRVPNEAIRDALKGAAKMARETKSGMWKDAEKAGELIQAPGPSAPPEELTSAQAFESETQVPFRIAPPAGLGPRRGPPGSPSVSVPSDSPLRRDARQRNTGGQTVTPPWNRPLFNSAAPPSGIVPYGGVNPPTIQPAPRNSSRYGGSSYYDRRTRRSGRYNLNHDANGNIIGLTPSGPITGNLQYFENQRVPADRGN
jgi:endonuclease YncB( thermonuclease family)